MDNESAYRTTYETTISVGSSGLSQGAQHPLYGDDVGQNRVRIEKKQNEKRLNWNKSCAQRLPFLSTLLSAENMGPQFASGVLEWLHVGIGESSSDISCVPFVDAAKVFVSAFNEILFSRKTGYKRSVWTSAVGRSHLSFRVIVVRRLITSWFSSDIRPIKKMISNQSGIPENNIEVPEWIVNRIIRDEDLLSVVERMGSKNHALPSNTELRIGSPSLEAMANFAVHQLFHGIQNSIRNGRRRLQSTFFRKVGFVLVDWSKNHISCQRCLCLYLPR